MNKNFINNNSLIYESIEMDCTDIVTDLCNISKKYRSDKCPYIKNPYPESNTVHPYTAIYDSLFSPIRHKKLNVVEIGVAYNDSICIWREYFPNSKIYGFDINENFIMDAEKEKLPNVKYDIMNVSDEFSISSALKKNKVKYDIIIDDSNHIGDDQIKIIKNSVNYLNSGGFLVIEDINREQDEQYYLKKIKNPNIYPYFSKVLFISAEHRKRNFGDPKDWPYFNDKILILVRNNTKKQISY